MIVVSMTNCPPKLRGDLSKWLMEINTGVYVGQLNARVRDALWKRICDNIGNGQATMVFSTNNEQHMDFYVHNSEWKPVDLDGIKMMKHPGKIVGYNQEELQTGFSNASKRRIGNRKRRKVLTDNYVILDIETTGLSPENDHIIEVGALDIRNGSTYGEYNALVKCEVTVPEFICEMTGITDRMLIEYGINPTEALHGLFSFISGRKLLIYNASFDIRFLEESARKYGLVFPEFEMIDLLKVARARIKGLDSYRLGTVADFLDVGIEQAHRAIDDCRLLNIVYSKLNEI